MPDFNMRLSKQWRTIVLARVGWIMLLIFITTLVIGLLKDFALNQPFGYIDWLADALSIALMFGVGFLFLFGFTVFRARLSSANGQIRFRDDQGRCYQIANCEISGFYFGSFVPFQSWLTKGLFMPECRTVYICNKDLKTLFHVPEYLDNWEELVTLLSKSAKKYPADPRSGLGMRLAAEARKIPESKSH